MAKSKKAKNDGHRDPFGDDEGHGRKPTVPTQVIFDLVVNHGHNYSQVAELTGLTPQAISSRCRKHGIVPKKSLESYKSTRADRLAMKQNQLLDGMTQGAIDTSNIKDLAIAIDKLGHNERLERGEATEHVLYADLSNEVDDLRKQYEDIKKRKNTLKISKEDKDNEDQF